MTSQEQVQVQEMKARVQQKYHWLTVSEIETAYNIAVVDYIMYSYPSVNGRPTPDTLSYDFITLNRIEVRMLDIISRAGGLNAVAYKENGIDIKYGSSYVDHNWIASLGCPKVGVPR